LTGAKPLVNLHKRNTKTFVQIDEGLFSEKRLTSEKLCDIIVSTNKERGFPP